MTRVAIIKFDTEKQAEVLVSCAMSLEIECQVLRRDTKASKLTGFDGIILGPSNLKIAETKGVIDKAIFDLGIPILGICYGHQIIVGELGGECGSINGKLNGYTKLSVLKNYGILKYLDREEEVWESHTYEVKSLPDGFQLLASTEGCRVAAIADLERHIYGVQFHPEYSPDWVRFRIFKAFKEIVLGR